MLSAIDIIATRELLKKLVYYLDNLSHTQYEDHIVTQKEIYDEAKRILNKC